MSREPSNTETELRLRQQQLSLEFDASFPSEKHCVEAIFSMICPDSSILCRNCGSKTNQRDFGSRYLVCRACRSKSWFTSGTCFERVRKLRAWFKAIWLFEKRVDLNSASLAELLEVSTSTSWKIIQTLQIVILGCMDHEKSSLYESFLFLAAVCKRSRETPAGAHPKAEQEVFDEEELKGSHSESSELQTAIDKFPEFNDAEHTDCSLSGETVQHFGESGTKDLVLSLLRNGNKSFDQLIDESGKEVPQLSVILLIMRLSGLVDRSFGDVYSLTDKGRIAVIGSRQPDAAELKAASAAVQSIKQIFHGISRKYLELYLANHWFKLDHIHWSSGALLAACLKHGKVGIARIMEHVTPRCLPACLSISV